MSKPDTNDDSDVGKDGDFINVLVDLFGKIEYKMAFLLFIICFIVLSDIFVDNVVKPFSSSPSGIMDTKSSFIQIAAICAGYIIIDLLNKAEII